MQLNNNLKSFVSPQKIKELNNILKTNKHIILQGPTGCAKTYTIKSELHTLNIPFEYIELPMVFKSLTNNSAVIVEFESKTDIYKFIERVNSKKCHASRIIIETRCIFNKSEFSHKIFNNFLLCNFNRITDVKIGKFTNKIDLVNGNLHQLFLEKYLIISNNSEFSFYHWLGKIFYGGLEKLNKVKSVEFDNIKVIEYVRANAVYFLSPESIIELFILISETQDVFTIILFLLKTEKIKPASFYGFKSMERFPPKDKMIYF